MAVSKRLRHEVMRRDNHTCRYCGATAPDVKLTIDHVTPTTLGGSDDPSNLVTACADCNAGKSATPPDAPLVAAIHETSDRWVDAVAEATVRRNDELQRQRTARRVCDAFELLWQHWCSQYELGPGWRQSVTQLYAKGLDEDFLHDAIQVAASAEHVPAEARWRYFCGIGWRELDRRQELARERVRVEQPASSSPPADHNSFDYMAVFDDFVESLVEAMGGDEQVQKFMNHHLWEAMPVAHAAWRERLSDASWPLNPDQDTLEEAATDAARDAMSDYLADPMAELRRWHELRLAANAGSHIREAAGDACPSTS